MPNPNVDTPDYQRGVVNAQTLLATVAGGVGMVTVNVPPNAETIIVQSNQGAAPVSAACHGVGTGYNYTGTQAFPLTGGSITPTWFFDAAASVDSQVQITLSPIPAGQWFVYADAGTHVVTDVNKLVNRLGQQYVIPSVPGVTQNDHPPNELSYADAGFTATGTLVAAPPAGQRLRVFSMWLAVQTAGLLSTINFAGSDYLLVVPNTGAATQTIPGQGFPLPAAQPIGCFLSGAGQVYAGVWYTTETV